MSIVLEDMIEDLIKVSRRKGSMEEVVRYLLDAVDKDVDIPIQDERALVEYLGFEVSERTFLDEDVLANCTVELPKDGFKKYMYINPNKSSIPENLLLGYLLGYYIFNSSKGKIFMEVVKSSWLAPDIFEFAGELHKAFNVNLLHA